MSKERGNLKKSSRIDEELLCMKGLVEYLRQKICSSEVFWKREPDDPPDFWLAVGNRKFVVEVTSLAKDVDYFPRCERLMKEIEKQSKEKGWLSGKYILNVLGNPEIPKANSKDWKEMVEKTLSFVRQTMCLAQADKKIIHKHSKGVIGIEKYAKNGGYVALMHIPAKWEGDIQEELRGLIQKSLKEKQKRLDSFHQYPDKILLLYDAYIFADIEDVRQSFKEIEGIDWFHSIFWVQGLKKNERSSSMNNIYPRVYLLFTKDKNWT